MVELRGAHVVGIGLGQDRDEHRDPPGHHQRVGNGAEVSREMCERCTYVGLQAAYRYIIVFGVQHYVLYHM